MNDLLDKKIKSLMVRILGSIEKCNELKFDDIKDTHEYAMHGSDLKLMRHEILNACNDFKRSLIDDKSLSDVAKTTFYPQTIKIIAMSKVDFSGNIPVFSTNGDPITIRNFRTQVGAGIVYNNGTDCTYSCVGIGDVVNKLIPILDTAITININVANGKYESWKHKVRNIYLGEANV